MSSISKREQSYLANWAKTAECRIAQDVAFDESYFENRTGEETYLMEYDFDTANDLDEMMKKCLVNSRDEKLRRVCEVAALKERSIHAQEEKISCGKNQNEPQVQLPEFIYNF